MFLSKLTKLYSGHGHPEFPAVFIASETIHNGNERNHPTLFQTADKRDKFKQCLKISRTEVAFFKLVAD